VVYHSVGQAGSPWLSFMTGAIVSKAVIATLQLMSVLQVTPVCSASRRLHGHDHGLPAACLCQLPSVATKS